MYAALLAASLGLSLLLLSWLERPRRGPAVFYAVLATAALYTHPFAGLTLASHAVFVLVERARRGRDSRLPWRSILLAQVVAVALSESLGRNPDDPDAHLAAGLLMATWTSAFLQAHRIFQQTHDAEKAKAALLGIVEKGTVAVKAAMADTPFA